MNRLAKKYKLFIVITLAVLVVGMAIFGFFGFNQAIDYSKGYEVRVSIDQNTTNARQILQSSTEQYFDLKGVNPVDYATQQLNDGKIIVYKFDKDIKLDKQALKSHIQSNLDQNSLNNITANVEYDLVLGNGEIEIGWLLLGIGIGLVATFIYALIMEKLSGAVAMLCSSVVSALAFTSILSLVRLPSAPAFSASLVLAMALSAVLSLTTVAKLKESYKNSVNKPDVIELTEKVMKYEGKKYLFVAIAVGVCAVAISAFFMPYIMFAGGQILLAGLSATVVSYFVTPLLWSAIKSYKKKKN